MRIKIQDFNPLTGFSMGAIIIAMSIVFPNDENNRTTLIVLGIITIIVTIIFMFLKQKEKK